MFHLLLFRHLVVMFVEDAHRHIGAIGDDLLWNITFQQMCQAPLAQTVRTPRMRALASVLIRILVLTRAVLCVVAGAGDVIHERTDVVLTGSTVPCGHERPPAILIIDIGSDVLDPVSECCTGAFRQ